MERANRPTPDRSADQAVQGRSRNQTHAATTVTRMGGDAAPSRGNLGRAIGRDLTGGREPPNQSKQNKRMELDGRDRITEAIVTRIGGDGPAGQGTGARLRSRSA